MVKWVHRSFTLWSMLHRGRSHSLYTSAPYLSLAIKLEASATNCIYRNINSPPHLFLSRSVESFGEIRSLYLLSIDHGDGRMPF
jgi:hypothetical protein